MVSGAIHAANKPPSPRPFARDIDLEGLLRGLACYCATRRAVREPPLQKPDIRDIAVVRASVAFVGATLVVALVFGADIRELTSPRHIEIGF